MHTVPQPDGVPDIYCDQFSLAMTPYGIAITFSRSPSSPSPMQPVPGEPQAVVRMSLEHLKVLTMLLRRNLRQYELEQLGDTIRVPRAILSQMSLSEEDW